MGTKWEYMTEEQKRKSRLRSLAYQKSHPEKRRKIAKEYRERNKEKVDAIHKAYRDNNRQKINEQQKEYRLKNKEKIATGKAENRRANIQESLEKEQEYRETHRNEINSRFNARRYRIKRQCLEFFGGAKCSLCGFTSDCPAQFDFHHKDKSKKLFSISAKISAGAVFSDLTSELSKCMLLCRNCHSLLHYKGTSDVFNGDQQMRHDL